MTTNTEHAEWPVGRTIKAVRRLTKKEAAVHGWDEGDWQYHDGVVVELDDGSTLTPSQDWEGNKSGALFGAIGTTSYSVTPAEWAQVS
jgi:hypothetical protein